MFTKTKYRPQGTEEYFTLTCSSFAPENKLSVFIAADNPLLNETCLTQEFTSEAAARAFVKVVARKATVGWRST